MKRAGFVFLLVVFSLRCAAQFQITGRVLNQADTKPVINASVFLSNATIGAKTDNDGSFKLTNVKTGKYTLIISVVGYETYQQAVTLTNSDLDLPDLIILPMTINLNEVKIKPRDEGNRSLYYEWFQQEFLGASDIAKACKILNPEVLDFSFDAKTNTLSANATDFLEIENEALGFHIKYLLSDFTLVKNDGAQHVVHFEGSALFSDRKGSPGQVKRWLRARQNVYEGSAMHFLRSTVANSLDAEGFRIFQVATYKNPDRPGDSLINAKIAFYSQRRSGKDKDSLSRWIKLSKLPKTTQKLLHFSLNINDFVKQTDQKGLFAMGCDNDALFISYNKDHHFYTNENYQDLEAANNTDNTLIRFNQLYAFFDTNGGISNPGSVTYSGVWGRDRIAELLPLDYQSNNKLETSEGDLQAGYTAKLKAYLSAHITEKAYLQFDKPYYAAGDTIYFKAYVTSGPHHRLSDLSGVLHVDLINTVNKIDRSIKLQLQGGVANGDFTLPDSLPDGDYHVRAYTQWMRNDGNDAFFDRVIPVRSVLGNKIAESAAANMQKATKTDIAFMPEGGALVNGLRSKVAFKAVNGNGMGIALKGVIIDNADKQVCTFSDSRLGLGFFYLTPEAGKIYKAKVTFANGAQNTFALPTAETDGVVLTVANDSIPKAALTIQATKNFYAANANKEFTLVIYSGGAITTVPITLDEPLIKMDVAKRRLQTGVATFTLFSPSGEPLCERLAFVQNYDQLAVKVSSEQLSYGKRGKVNISLLAKNRAGNTVSGNFSATVSDESKVVIDENAEPTILTSLLLTTDLKGYLEQPGYYFKDNLEKNLNDLDLVMLTNGYRRFEWKALLKKYPPPSYAAESNLSISGIASTIGGKPLVKGTVSLVPTQGGGLLRQSTDDKGRFSFDNVAFTDSIKFVLQAVTRKNKNHTKLIYNKENEPPVIYSSFQHPDTGNLMAAYLLNARNRLNEYTKYGSPRGMMLKEVKIKDKKPDNAYQTANLNGAGHADEIIHVSKLPGGPTLASRLSFVMRKVHFVNEGFGTYAVLNAGGVKPVVVVDGIIEQGQYDLNQIPANDVETVEVLSGADAAIYGMQGGHGALIITTKQGSGVDPADVPSFGILPITVEGFYKAREFYAPKYDHLETNVRKDLRSTIFWAPNITTAEDGTASFGFFNADGTGSYRVVVEGIDNNGNIGRQVYHYKVE